MGSDNPTSLYRLIPSVDRLLGDAAIVLCLERWSPDLVKRAARKAVEDLRDEIKAGTAVPEDCEPSTVAQRAVEILEKRIGPKLTTLINATGVIVHTNLGRSPLSHRVVDRISKAALSYSNLEYNLAEGRRGERNSHLRTLMEELTGAEAVLAVNNNAAAVLLALSTLAQGREVIVSRGELIEIGGAFRIPDVMARSGAILREVGTTNRTHARDYEQAINDQTALLLKVHPSNYRIEGFTREVELEELVRIGRDHGVSTMMDLGSGCLIDLAAHGLTGETTVQETVAAGVDVVTFSGDKLLGGPQAGIIAGKRATVEAIRTNPLARALRMDKLTLAGLEATLEEYTRAGGPGEGIPTIAMITRSAEELLECAENLAQALTRELGHAAEIGVVEGFGRVGGGALPLGDLPGPRVWLKPRDVSAGRLEQSLRGGDPPVIVLTKEDAVLIDSRTLLHDQAEILPGLLAEALDRAAQGG